MSTGCGQASVYMQSLMFVCMLEHLHTLFVSKYTWSTSVCNIYKCIHMCLHVCTQLVNVGMDVCRSNVYVHTYMQIV